MPNLICELRTQATNIGSDLRQLSSRKQSSLCIYILLKMTCSFLMTLLAGTELPAMPSAKRFGLPDAPDPDIFPLLWCRVLALTLLRELSPRRLPTPAREDAL